MFENMSKEELQANVNKLGEAIYWLETQRTQTNRTTEEVKRFTDMLLPSKLLLQDFQEALSQKSQV